MRQIMSAALLPHSLKMVGELSPDPDLTLSGIIEAVEKVAQSFKEANLHTVIVMTPHGAKIEDAAAMSVHPRMKGTLSTPLSEVALGFETDGLLIRHIAKKADRLGLNLIELTDEQAKRYCTKLELDYGSLIPLYFLHKAGFRGQIIHLSCGMMPYEELYTLGKAVQAAVSMVDKRVGIMASGNLSHCLSPEASSYHPEAQKFDRMVVEALDRLNVKSLLYLDRQKVAEMKECGLRSIFFLLGALGGLEATCQFVHYDAPHGIGYAVAHYSVQ